MHRSRLLTILAILCVLTATHLAVATPTEPFWNNDETRHLMTGILFHDAVTDLPLSNPREYVERYYLQYPALGLLTWPPLFHIVEGVWMLAFGVGHDAARVLIGLFSAAACAFLFRLVNHTHDLFTAAAATLFFGFAPLVFTYSRHVMLEMPALAGVLASLFYFTRYLDKERSRHLWLAALCSSLTALTRFDGVLLLPLFAILLAARRRFDLLGRKQVWLAILMALALVLPYYTLALHEIGWVHWKSVQTGSAADSTEFLAPENFWFYPAQLPEQIGWFSLVLSLVGVGGFADAQNRRSAWPYFALILATYVTFAPLAELESRHAIYWVPAFAVLAACGVTRIAGWLRRPAVAWLLAGGAVAGTAWLALINPRFHLRGYEVAARYVLAHSTESDRCLFDSYLNGNFIYQVRHADPERRLWVLRGDKLLYGVLSDPAAGYEEYARDDQEILELIAKYDPEYIVVEDPQVHFNLPMAARLRAVLRDNPDRFVLEKEVPVQSNLRIFGGVRLRIYRNQLRNPYPTERLELNMFGLQRLIGTELPRRD
jgi:hypothetical protein